MKKIYSLLFASLVIAPVTQAKTTGITIPNIFPHYGSGGAANQPSQNSSRIIAYTYLRHDGAGFVPVDSTTYSYSFGRGGQLSSEDMDDNFVNFDDSYTYSFSQASGDYINRLHRSQIFNISDKAQTYTCQSWKSNAWKDSSRFLYSYNNDQTLLMKTNFQIFYGGQWSSHVTYVHTYDGNNNLVKMSSTVFKMTFTYDASNNLTSREDSAWTMPLGWHKSQKILFNYDAASRLTSYVIQIHANNTWVNSIKYEYTLNGSEVTLIKKYDWGNNAWEIKGRHLFTYDQFHNKTIDEWQYWDAAASAFTSASRERWTYNNYSQPLTYFSETFDPAGSAWTNVADDFYYRYYYQSFNPNSVNKVAAGSFALSLYPQPASQMLHVDIGLDKPEPYSISVFDGQGRVVRQLNGSGTNREHIDVADLAPGNYFLKISTIDKQQSRQFIVVR